jgi:GxxExxY protein
MEGVAEYCQRIYEALGPGYSERVYHNAMEVLLRRDGIAYESERIVPIVFEEHTIGNLRSDIIVGGEIVLEFKSVKALTEPMELQARNYLKLMKLKTAYLINFGHRDLEVRCILAE